MKCVKCKINYPEGIVNEAFMNGKYIPLCGICYEDITGVILHGEMATLARDLALEFRGKNPQIKVKL